MPPADPAPTRTAFPHFRREVLRFRDLDTLGHVTSAAFLDLAEGGRVALLRAIGAATPESWIAREQTVNFLGQLHFPGEVDVGTGIRGAHDGEIAIDQALFDGERCVATIATRAAPPAGGAPAAAVPAQWMVRC